MAEAEAELFADEAQQLDVPQAIQAQLLEERAAVASGKAASAQKLVYLEQAAQCHRQANSIMQVSVEVRRVMAHAGLSLPHRPLQLQLSVTACLSKVQHPPDSPAN